MKKAERQPWHMNLDQNYEPKVTIIVATYNEASVIERKIQNLRDIKYPKEKLEAIVVDSASTDGTANIAREYITKNGFPFSILVLEEEERKGKTAALNFALHYATGDVIATSDADSMWTPDSLRSAIKYLSDSSIGAVTGREIVTNPNQSSSTRTETMYRGMTNHLRLGESKLNSTIIFAGELSLFKKDLLERFNGPADDSGSALDLVQKGYRTIMITDAFFANPVPKSWKEKSTVKVRRAQHLVEIWYKCLKLDMKRELKLNGWISRANVFLHLINPFLFPLFLCTLLYALVNYPILALTLPLVFLVSRLREAIILYVSNHSFQLYAVIRQMIGKRQVIWKT